MSRLKLTDQTPGGTPTPAANKRVLISRPDGFYSKGSDGLEMKLIEDHDVAHIESIMNLSILYAGGF